MSGGRLWRAANCERITFCAVSMAVGRGANVIEINLADGPGEHFSKVADLPTPDYLLRVRRRTGTALCADLGKAAGHLAEGPTIP